MRKKHAIDGRQGWVRREKIKNPKSLDDPCYNLPLFGFHPFENNDYDQTPQELEELFVHLKDDDRPFVQIQIFEIPLMGLLDSGAHRILGTGSQNIINACKLKILPTKVELVTASGQKLRVKGCVNLPMTCNGDTKLIETLVVPDLKRSLILGTDFWKAFQIVPSIASSSVDELGVHISPLELTQEQVKELEAVKAQFKVAEEGKLDTTSLICHRIELSDEAKKKPAVRINPFPTSPKRQEQINKELDEMLRAGIIERSYSDWALRLVPVDKPDDSVRLCLDARLLNERTVRDSYPLPHADRILSRLGPCKYISTIDLSKAFLHIPLHPKSKKYTAFSVLGRGLFHFTRMPFGLVNSPATLSRLMDRVLGGGELEPKVFIYLDDIIIISDTFEEHMNMLREVARRLGLANLSINIEKSKFCVTEVHYLGYILSTNGLRPNPNRVGAVVNFERPNSLRALRRFLGMCNY